LDKVVEEIAGAGKEDIDFVGICKDMTIHEWQPTDH